MSKAVNSAIPNILIVTRNFPPLTGGMERLIHKTYQQLSARYNCTVIGPKGGKKYVGNKDRYLECSNNLFMFFIQAFCYALFYRLGTMNLCIAGSGLTTPISYVAAKRLAIPYVCFIHGLDLIVESRIYQWFFLPFIRKSSCIIANSHNTARLARQKGINQANIEIVYPGVEAVSESVELDSESSHSFFEKYDLVGKKIILSVGRLIPRKGLYEFVDQCLPGIVKQHKNAVLLIIGGEAKQALKKNVPITESIEEVARHHDIQNNVMMLGKVDDNVMNAAYRQAELFIFPVRDIPGDVEGFGMVALEAASFGLPTVAFNAGGVSDAVLHQKTGVLVAAGDYTALAQQVIDFLNPEIKQKMDKSCIEFAVSMQWSEFAKSFASKILSKYQL